MNRDIRLSVGFWSHPKTKKTVKRLGLEGIQALQVLWLWAAVNRPDGNLSGMDWEDIELASDWQGEEKAFFNFCIGEGNASTWIDTTLEGEFVLHDWAEHNPWQAEADTRSDSARFARLAQVNKAAYNELKSRGITVVSKDIFGLFKDVKGSPSECQAVVNKHFGKKVAAASKSPRECQAVAGDSSGPKPQAPLPSPSPKPEEKKNTKHASNTKTPCARDYTHSTLGTSCEEEAYPWHEHEQGTCTQGQGATPKKTDCPSKGNPEWTSFLSCYKVYPVKQGQEDAWREWIRLKNNRVLEPAWAIRDAILNLSANDSRWLEGMVPRMAKWLNGKGWNDEPYVKPNTGKDQNGGPPSKTPEQIAKERVESEKMLAAIKQRSRIENKKLLEKQGAT